MTGLYQPGPVNKNKLKQAPSKVIGDVSKTPGTQIPPAKPLTTEPQRMALNKTPRKGSVSGQDRNPYKKKQQGGNLFKTNKTAFVDSTLNANKDLEWVKRLRQPNTPSIETPQNIEGVPRGSRSTHLMSDDGRGYVFPAIVDRGRGLEYLGTNAENYARKTNTGIQFPENKGTWFAANGYKQGTGVLKQQQGGKYPPMNEAEAAAGVDKPPMVPSTLGDKIHNAISDVGTGVATWGTSFRPPTQGELQQGRGSWGDRAKLLAGATEQGLTNEMLAAGIGKVAGEFIPKAMPSVVPESRPIDVGSRMYNRQNVTNELAINAPMSKDLTEWLNGLSPDKFADYAKERGGYTNIGRYFTVTPSGRKEGGLLSPKKARTILHDKEVRGHPLTDKQRRFFGAMSNKKKQGGGSIQRQSFSTQVG